MNIIQKSISAIDRQQGQKTNQEFFLLGLIIAVVILFLPFAGILIFCKKNFAFSPPKTFTLSSFLIIGSSLMILKAKTFIKLDKIVEFKKILILILGSGFLFLYFQYIGWDSIFFLYKSSLKNILSVIVLVHALHFIAALILISALIIKSLKVKSSTDFFIWNLKPSVRFFTKLVFAYWELMSALWIALFLLMLIV